MRGTVLGAGNVAMFTVDLSPSSWSVSKARVLSQCLAQCLLPSRA